MDKAKRPKGWRVVKRLSGLIEWTCPHGVGHPAPIKKNEKLIAKGLGVHGCDGCCSIFHKNQTKENK